MEVRLLTLALFSLIAGIPASERRAISPQQATPYNQDESVSGNKVEGGVVKICPPGQLLHNNNNNTVCCLPIACEPGYQLIKCTEDGHNDSCKKCNSAYMQPYYTASSDKTVAKCFPYNEPKHSKCPRGETKLKHLWFSDNCPLRCTCNPDRCYYGDPCACNQTYPSCGVDEEMDPDTGSCQPCPQYTYKNVTGCQRCRHNITLWRMGIEDLTPDVRKSKTSPSTTTTTEKSSTPEKDQDAIYPEEVVTKKSTRQDGENDTTSDVNTLLIVIVVVGAAFLGLTVALVVVVRRGSSSSPQSGRLSTLLSDLVLRCPPNKPRPQNTPVSTGTTPVSDETSLLTDPESPTTNLELVDEHGSEDTALKVPNGKPADDSFKVIYNRVGTVQGDVAKESARNVQRENYSYMRQNSVTVGAEIHSSSSSSVGSSDHDEMFEDGIKPTKPKHMQDGVGGARHKTYQMKPGSTAAPKRDPAKAGSLFGAEVDPRTTDRSVSAQGPSLNNQGRLSNQNRALVGKGGSLVRGQLFSESDEDTGICMEGSDPQMMKLCSVSMGGVSIPDNTTGRLSTDQTSYEPDQSGFATETVPQTLGERNSPVGQSYSLASPARETSPALSLKMPSEVPSIDGGGSPGSDRGDNPITPSQTTPSPRIQLPSSPGEFQGRVVAHVQPLSRVNEMDDYQSGPSSSANMEGSSLSVASYFQGIGHGSLDIANQADFSSSDFAAIPQNNSQQNPAYVPPPPTHRRFEPDGESRQPSPGFPERGRLEQTRLKQVVPSRDNTQETIPKCVATVDSTTRKTATATPMHNKDIDSDNSKMREVGDGITNDKTKDTEGEVGITQDPNTATDTQAKALSPDKGAAVSDLEMENLKACESETQTAETRVSDNTDNICDSGESSVELPNPAVDVSGDSFELPNDWEGMETEKDEGDES